MVDYTVKMARKNIAAIFGALNEMGWACGAYG